MRNLKKVLSMVLVVAMIASMLVVGAAAAEETTNYEEAAAVTIGIGIIEGDETGYNYQGLLTREQAAKLIAYMLLGKDTAEALKVSSAPFADVAATRWSAPYIAYLKGQGIISGVSDTEFDPTANVTGIALAKMMLSAVGYGANGEFEGAAWDINTITFANDNGVFDGTLATDLADPATREEAMLYMFNTLTKVPTVKWNATFETYYTGKSALDPVTGEVNPADVELDANDAYYYTLGWAKYALKQSAGEGETDALGRPAATWNANGIFVAEAVANIAPDAILYGSVSSGTLYNALGKAVVTNLNKNMVAHDVPAASMFEPAYTYYTTDNITVYIDGVEQEDYEWYEIKSGEILNAVAGTGATTELYLNYEIGEDNVGYYTLDIVIWYEHIGTVTKVDAAKDLIEVDGMEFEGAAGYTKKDIVIYTVGEAEDEPVVLSVRPAEGVIGTYTGTDFMSNKLIDGVATSVSKIYSDSIEFEIGVAYELYYDAQGNVLRADVYDAAGATGAYQYLYVINAEAQVADEDSLLEAKDAKVLMTVVYPDGGKEVVSYAIKYSNKLENYYITINGYDYELNAANVANIDGATLTSFDEVDGVPVTTTLGGWMTYTKNDAGAVTLKHLNENYAAVNAGATSTTTGYATIVGLDGRYMADSKTVLTKIDKNGSVLTFTGVSNFPTGALSGDVGSVVYTYAKDSFVIKSIVAYVDTADLTSGLDFAYCAYQWSSDINGYTYAFYIDGTTQFITFEESLGDGATGKVYDLKVDNGEYSVEAIDYYGVIYDEAFNVIGNNAAGMVNNGMGIHGTKFSENSEPNCVGYMGQQYAYYGSINFDTFATEYFEHATIDTLDANYFTTIAGDEDTNCSAYCASKVYYFDSNTVIYDATMAGGGAIVDELTEGDVFIAYVNDDDGSSTFKQNYVQYIWIVA